jgi:hypothetical protein
MTNNRKWLYIVIVMIATLVAVYLRQPDHTVHASDVTFPANGAFKGTLTLAIDSWQGRTAIVMNLDSGQGGPGLRSQWDPTRPVYCQSTDSRVPMQEFRAPSGLRSIPCGATSTLVIKGSRGEQIAVRTISDNLPIRDIAWSPDSRSAAVLVEESKSEYFSRQGLLSLIHSLQPLPLVHYRLFLYSPESDLLEELPLPSNYIQGGWVAMEWFPS